MGTIRIETEGSVDLARVYSWMTRHRGQVVALDETRRLALGVPITGARSVLVAAVVQDETRPGPELGGVVRALSNRTDAEPTKLVFEGRSSGALTRDEAEAIATGVLRRISGLVVDEGSLAEVA
jgi:hypothetical protein